jgi:sugar lactone lactonase YvrE
MRRNRMLAGLAMLGALLIGPPSGEAGDPISTLHTFNQSGYAPYAGIVTDRRGDIFGTTTSGGTGPCDGDAGCGTVFWILPPGGARLHWTYQPIYDFQGGADGYFPTAPVTLDDSGAVYGYPAGGSYGTVFRLQPPSPTGTRWKFEILYVFEGQDDGDLLHVSAPLLLYRGLVYGIASGGADGCGADGCGSVFRLDPGAPGERWTKTTLFAFAGGATGGRPQWIAGFDADGALYVSTASDKGAVVRLSPTATPNGTWNEKVLTTFTGGLDGSDPGDLILAPNGTLFGLAVATREAGGLVYQLTPSSTGVHWRRSVVAYVKDHGYAPNSVAFGTEGTLIGAISGDPDFFAGSLYQLKGPPTSCATWTFTELWNFNRGPDRNPINAVIGRGGNIFSILNGGDSSNGSVVELCEPAGTQLSRVC